MSNISASLVKDLRVKSGAGMMDCKKALAECDGDFEAAVDWLRKKGLSAAAKKSDRAATDGLVAVAISGEKGALVEVNAETDFVARNELFQTFVSDLAQVALSHGSVEALLDAPYPNKSHNVAEELTQLIATVGENMKLRRVEVLESKGGVVGCYVHGAVQPNLGKIGVLVALQGGDEALGKQLAMHVAAARPQFLQVSDIDSDTLDRERQILTDQAKDSGKPPEVIEKMVEGRLRKFYEESVFLEQVYVVDGESKVNKVIGSGSISGFIRFELGEGLEKKQEDFAAEVAATAQGS